MVSQIKVGEAIVRLRKLRGLSQEKFALESGIDRRYLSDVENGKRNISFELLNRVASYFNVSLSSFIKEAEQGSDFKNVDELRLFLLEHGYERTGYFTTPDYIDAIIGINDGGRLVYSFPKMVEHLVFHRGMRHDEAMEFIENNTTRAMHHMGEHAPIIVYSIT